MLSSGHARALLGLSDPEEMDKLASRIIAEGLSVRSTEEIVAMKTVSYTHLDVYKRQWLSPSAHPVVRAIFAQIPLGTPLLSLIHIYPDHEAEDAIWVRFEDLDGVLSYPNERKIAWLYACLLYTSRCV